jgi:hypothetical protein
MARPQPRCPREARLRMTAPTYPCDKKSRSSPATVIGSRLNAAPKATAQGPCLPSRNTGSAPRGVPEAWRIVRATAASAPPGGRPPPCSQRHRSHLSEALEAEAAAASARRLSRRQLPRPLLASGRATRPAFCASRAYIALLRLRHRRRTSATSSSSAVVPPISQLTDGDCCRTGCLAAGLRGATRPPGAACGVGAIVTGSQNWLSRLPPKPSTE